YVLLRLTQRHRQLSAPVPIHYVMAGMSGDKPKADFQLGMALLILDTNDKGDGEHQSGGHKIKADAAGSIVIDDYGAKVWLKDVAKAK
ncbi:MAG: hypothetical protein MZU84_01960, partial [Sphingobacterium sp.]|nr:hypothetical protein [Sphingobacterium sp.]